MRVYLLLDLAFIVAVCAHGIVLIARAVPAWSVIWFFPAFLLLIVGGPVAGWLSHRRELEEIGARVAAEEAAQQAEH
jgi:cytochrome c-type biogenesis protein CcmH/NrfF